MNHPDVLDELALLVHSNHGLVVLATDEEDRASGWRRWPRPAKPGAGRFDLQALAAAADRFTGAEIEQVIISALYAAFAGDAALTQELLAEEVGHTRPLAHVARERVEALREWARERTVRAN